MYPEPVQPVDDLVAVFRQLPSSVLLEAKRRHTNPLAVHVHLAVHRGQSGPPKAAGVRPVDHDLPHEMDFIHWGHAQQLRHFERRLDGTPVRVMWRLFVRLDQARIWHSLVSEVHLAFGFLESRPVYLSHLALGRPQPPDELLVVVVRQVARAFAEQLPSVQLLVNLDPDLETYGPEVQIRSASWRRTRQRCSSASAS